METFSLLKQLYLNIQPRVNNRLLLTHDMTLYGQNDIFSLCMHLLVASAGLYYIF